MEAPFSGALKAPFGGALKAPFGGADPPSRGLTCLRSAQHLEGPPHLFRQTMSATRPPWRQGSSAAGTEPIDMLNKT